MKIRSNSIAFLTYYLMLAGLIGLLVSFLLLRNPEPAFWYWLTLITQGLLFFACFYAGYLFLNKDYKRAIDWSIIVQFLQLVSFSAGGWSYYFVSGVGLFIGYSGATEGLDLSAGISEFEWLIVPRSEAFSLSINIIALIILIILFRLRRSHK